MRHSDKVLAYFHQAEHVGKLDNMDPQVVLVEASDGDQGNVLRLYLSCQSEKILTARFLVYGSVAVTACCEYVCQWLEGKTLSQAKGINAEHILQALDMPKMQNHAALFVERSVIKALEKCYGTT